MGAKAKANAEAAAAWRESSTGKDGALDIVRDIEDAAERSAGAKDASMRSARRAASARKAGEDAAWKDAMGAVSFQLSVMNRDASDKRWQELHPPKPWREYAAEAATRASRPLLVASAQAQQVAEQWHLLAAAAATGATKNRAEARALADSASDSWARGRKADAERDQARADALAERAREDDDKAADMQADARTAARSANGYYAAANDAARRAGAATYLPGELPTGVQQITALRGGAAALGR